MAQPGCSSPTLWRVILLALGLVVFVVDAGAAPDTDESMAAMYLFPGATFRVSSSLGAGFDERAAVDGSLCTAWIVEPKSEGEYLEVLFAQPVRIEEIRVVLAEAAGRTAERQETEYWLESGDGIRDALQTLHYVSGPVETASRTVKRFVAPPTTSSLRVRVPAADGNSRFGLAELALKCADRSVPTLPTPSHGYREELEEDESYQVARGAMKETYYDAHYPRELFARIADATDRSDTVRAHAMLDHSLCDDRANISYPPLKDQQIPYLQSIIERFPHQRDAVALAWCRIGEHHARAHRFAEAETALARVISRYPDTEAAWWARLAMMDVAWWQGWIEPARTAFDELERGYAAGHANMTQYGWALFKAVQFIGDPSADDALNDAQREWLVYLWEELKDVPGAEEPAAMAKHKLAFVEQSKGHWPWALAHYQELYDTMPNLPGWSSHTLLQIAKIYMELKQYAPARAALDELGRKFPSAPETELIDDYKRTIEYARQGLWRTDHE